MWIRRSKTQNSKPQGTKARGRRAHGLPRRPRIGVALGGGMARGWAHIGVLKAMADLGLAPDIVAGTSIGAVAGAAFACDRLDALEAWSRSLKALTFWRHMRLRALDGLFSSTQFGRLMHQQLGSHRIEDLPVPFGVVAADLGSGQEVWLRHGDMAEAVRASFAIPGLFAPVEIEGRPLADGAIVNPVPVTLARALGADLVVAISLSGELLPGHWGRAGRHGQPNLFGSIATAFHIMQHRLNRARLAGDPPDVQVSVACQHVGLMDFQRAEELIALGDAALRAAAPRIEAALTLLAGGLEEHPA
jgi:NTE family protein